MAALVTTGLALSSPALGAGPETPTADVIRQVPGPTGADAPRLEAPRTTDQAMRMDRAASVFSATGYQTLAVLGLVTGAAAIGALGGGASGALAAGAAVLMVYTFMR